MIDEIESFTDISTNAKTKEEYLSKGCQARIRGYLSKARTQLFATKLDSILAKEYNDDKEDVKCTTTSIDSLYTKPKRKTLTSLKNRGINLNEHDHNLEVETLDEENWDEIDATLLRNYRSEFKSIAM